MSCTQFNSDLVEFIDTFVTKIRNNANSANNDRMINSIESARETLGLAKRVIGGAKWTTAADLMAVLKSLGESVSRRIKGEEVIFGNIIRRVLKLVREEYSSCISQMGGGGNKLEDNDPQESLHKMVLHVDKDAVDGSKSSSDPSAAVDFSVVLPGLKSRVIERVEELDMEIETGTDEIAKQALEHIHTNEVILTLGRSRTVERFLKQAAKERKFQVIVAEGAPFYQGQAMAASLARSNIATTVITDSAIFAIMSRVNKVIIGTSAILANGGLKAIAGCRTVALAAKHYSVPLYVCASMIKLSPIYWNGDEDSSCNTFASPQETLHNGLDGSILSKVHVTTPVFEYVPPNLVTLFISDLNGHGPSYIYRYLSEFYHPDDYDLKMVKER